MGRGKGGRDVMEGIEFRDVMVANAGARRGERRLLTGAHYYIGTRG